MQTGEEGTVKPENGLQPPVVHSPSPAKTAGSTAIQIGKQASKANTTSNSSIPYAQLTTASCFLSSCFLPATSLQTLCASCCAACDRRTCPALFFAHRGRRHKGCDSRIRHPLPPLKDSVKVLTRNADEDVVLSYHMYREQAGL